MHDTDPVLAAPEPEIAARLQFALEVAGAASAVLMRHFGRLASIDEKSPVDLVTEADRQSEQLILERLQAAFPADVVLAEERDGRDGARALAARVRELPWCWAIDPLDGTTNFAHTHHNFCVSIGILRYGEPFIGVVQAPVRQERFVGVVGAGATCNAQLIGVSQVATMDKSLIGTGFPYDRRQRLPQLLRWLGRTLERAHCVRRGGSAALDLCEIAAGRLDGYYEVGLAPWDTAAGSAIVRAAGGRVSAFSGTEHDLFAANTLASNGRIHAELVDLVAEEQRG